MYHTSLWNSYLPITYMEITVESKCSGLGLIKLPMPPLMTYIFASFVSAYNDSSTIFPTIFDSEFLGLLIWSSVCLKVSQVNAKTGELGCDRQSAKKETDNELVSITATWNRSINCWHQISVFVKITIRSTRIIIQ